MFNNIYYFYDEKFYNFFIRLYCPIYIEIRNLCTRFMIEICMVRAGAFILKGTPLWYQ